MASVLWHTRPIEEEHRYHVVGTCAAQHISAFISRTITLVRLLTSHVCKYALLVRLAAFRHVWSTVWLLVVGGLVLRVAVLLLVGAAAHAVAVLLQRRVFLRWCSRSVLCVLCQCGG